jgi:hypothetical protein
MSLGDAGVVVALAIVAHGWAGRMQGPPAVLSVIGWAVNIIALIVLVLIALRHGVP